MGDLQLVVSFLNLLGLGGFGLFLYYLFRGLRERINTLTELAKEQNKTLDAVRDRAEETSKLKDSYKQAFLDFEEMGYKIEQRRNQHIKELEAENQRKGEELIRRAQLQISTGTQNLSKFYKAIGGNDNLDEEHFLNLYKNAFELRGAILASRAVQQVIGSIGIVKSMLILYSQLNVEKQFSEAPKVQDLLERLEELSNKVTEGLANIQKFNIKEAKDLFAAFPSHVNIDEEFEAIDKVKEEVDGIIRSMSKYTRLLSGPGENQS